MFKGYIYRHWIVNDKGIEKSYIGQTTMNSPQRRWGKDGNGYLRSKYNSKFNRAIKKYGWSNFHHEIIGIVESNNEKQLAFDLDEWEKYYIDKYNSFFEGYNSTSGGTNGMVFSEETRQKISNAGIGKKHSEETKQKISEAQKGRIFSEETKQKMSENHADIAGSKNPMYGKHHTEESKLKMSKALSGKEHSEETKQKMSEARKGNRNAKTSSVICLNTLHIFETIEDAQRWIGKGNICHCCRGKSKTAGKHPVTGERLQWMYYDEWLQVNEK